ncbi:hypothetical protein E4U54_006513 [Claviceps lovelessii]|nr:hypothetical protein E4U54_006513 [Claviceps lovelessii]
MSDYYAAGPSLECSNSRRCGDINSDNLLTLTGPLEVTGNVRSGGSIHLEGDVIITGSVDAYGPLTTKGNVSCGGTVKSYGSLKISGVLDGQGLEIYGKLSCKNLSVYGSLSLIGPASTYTVEGSEQVLGSRLAKAQEPDWDL